MPKDVLSHSEKMRNRKKWGDRTVLKPPGRVGYGGEYLPLATITLWGASRWSEKGRKSVVHWLRKHATFLLSRSHELSDRRFTARYLVRLKNDLEPMPPAERWSNHRAKNRPPVGPWDGKQDGKFAVRSINKWTKKHARGRRFGAGRDQQPAHPEGGGEPQGGSSEP